MAHPISTTLIARTLRGLGLRQGKDGDFIVRGFYYRGERLGAMVFTRTQRADRVLAINAEQVEAQTTQAGCAFVVSIYARVHEPHRLSWATACNFGPRTRDLSPTQVAEQQV